VRIIFEVCPSSVDVNQTPRYSGISNRELIWINTGNALVHYVPPNHTKHWRLKMKFRSMMPVLWGDSANNNAPYHALQTEIDRLFSDFASDFPSPAQWNGTGKLLPKLDVAETENAFEVTAELPGVDEKDIDVTITDDVLRIKAEKKSEKEEKTKDYHLVERSYGTFERNMRLPFRADSARVDAKFEKGVLKLTVQKPAEIKTKMQKIEVKTAA
jgi:HSP20 family protein